MGPSSSCGFPIADPSIACNSCLWEKPSTAKSPAFPEGCLFPKFAQIESVRHRLIARVIRVDMVAGIDRAAGFVNRDVRRTDLYQRFPLRVAEIHANPPAAQARADNHPHGLILQVRRHIEQGRRVAAALGLAHDIEWIDKISSQTEIDPFRDGNSL